MAQSGGGDFGTGSEGSRPHRIRFGRKGIGNPLHSGAKEGPVDGTLK